MHRQSNPEIWKVGPEKLGKEGGMLHCRPLGAMLLAVLVSSISGCLAVYSTSPVEIDVSYRDSDQPAADVPVTVKYHQLFVLNAPESVSGKTDNSGTVTVPMADFNLGVIEVKAGATKFLLTGKTVRRGGELKDGQVDWRGEGPPVCIRLKPQRSALQRFFDATRFN